MFRRSKTATALLGGIIWIFLLKTAVALPFPAMESLEMPIRSMNESLEMSSSVISDRTFSRSYPALQRRFSSPEAGGKTPLRPSLLAIHFAEGWEDHGEEKGFDAQVKAGSSTVPSEKPLLSGVMAPELGMGCSNPLTGPGSRSPATFTLMAVGFAGMVVGRFRLGRF